MTSLERTTHRAVMLILLFGFLCAAGCVSVKVVSVDRKTQLENQILGSLDTLQGDLVLLASVRGEDAPQSKLPPAQREALLAMMNRQFNADDVESLKLSQVLGENNQGLLSYFDTAQTRNDPNFKAFATRIMNEENRDRRIIMERLITLNPNLSESDLPLVRDMLYKLNSAASAPGTKIQLADGTWTTVIEPDQSDENGE